MLRFVFYTDKLEQKCVQ